MAIKNKFPVAMGDVFPHGAFIVSEEIGRAHV